MSELDSRVKEVTNQLKSLYEKYSKALRSRFEISIKIILLSSTNRGSS
jgi:hypothetical protein